MRHIVLLSLCASLCLAQNRTAEFHTLADHYFDEAVFRYDPAQATEAGFHQYDSLLPSWSHTEIEAEISTLKQWETKVRTFGLQGLSQWDSSDRDLVLAQIQGQLLMLESIRMWEKNPDMYSSNVTNAIFVIMSRNFAPAPDRLKSVIAREKLIPRVFASARENLKNPPQIYTEVALEQLPGIISFFKNDVPKAFHQVTDPALLAEFHKDNQAVIDALNAYQTWLQKDLLPRSHGDFRIGADAYRKKLLYDEMVDIPLDRLLEIGYQDLRRNQAEFRKVAAQIDPKRTPQQILDDLEHDHPPAANLLQSFRGVLGGLRDFIQTASHRHHPFARPAHRRRDTALHARAHHRVDGHTRPLRKGRQGSVLQRHPARSRLVRPRDRGIHGGLQPRDHHQHRDCTKSTPATTPSFSGCSRFPPRSVNCSIAARTPKAGRTTASR